MPINDMNVGVDYSLFYYDGTSGALVDFGDVQNVQDTPLKHDIKSMPYNAPPRYGYVPDGHRLEFTVTRTGSTLDDMMATFSKTFNAGSVQKPGFLNKSVTNPDGSVSRYQYTNFVVYPTDLGNISRDKVVTQKLEGYASDMVQIA